MASLISRLASVTFNSNQEGFVDAVYGNAAYMPMSDGARYEVTLSQTGLIARPVNAAAQQAAGTWK